MVEVNKWKKRIEKSEPLDGGDTNDIYLTDDDTLIKVFRAFSFPVIVHSVGYFLSGRLNYLGSEERIRREIGLRESLEKLEIGFPEVVRREDKYLEVEYLDGETIGRYLERNPGEAEKLGRRVGSLMRRLHSEDISLCDWDIENLMLVDGEINLLDFEYGEKNSSGFDKFVDHLTLLMSLRTLGKEIYSDFKSGFETEHKLSRSSLFVSVPFALGYALIVRKNLEMFHNVLSSLGLLD